MPRLPDARIIGAGIAANQDRDNDGFGLLSGPMRTLGGLMKLKEAHLELQQKRREQEDEDAIRQTMSTASTPEEGIDALWRTHPTAASKYTKIIAEQRKAEDSAMEQHLKNVGERMKLGTQIAQGMYDEASYKTGAPALVAMVGPIFGEDAVRQQLGTTYDPEKIKALVNYGMSASDRINAQDKAAAAARADTALMNKAAMDNLNIADIKDKRRAIQNTMASSLLESSRDQTEWDNNMKILHGRGVPDDILQPYGRSFLGDSSKQHARSLGLTPEQKEQASNRAKQDAFTERRVSTAEDREQRLSESGGTGASAKVGPGTTAYGVSLRARDEGRLKVQSADFAYDKSPAQIAAAYLALENSVRQQNNMPTYDEEAESLRDSADPGDQKKLGTLLKYVLNQTGAPLPGFENYKPGERQTQGVAKTPRASGKPLTAPEKAARSDELLKLIYSAEAAGDKAKADGYRKELRSLGAPTR